MAEQTNALSEIQALFGHAGGDTVPGNIGQSRTVVSTCNKIMAATEPALFDYFMAWDTRNDQLTPLAVELSLASVGQWEGAWALAQLHYDQLLKQEVKTQSRLHKGHPLCNLAILAREMGSPALTRTYAMFSSAGDLYWSHNEPSLLEGGYGRTMLEQFESYSALRRWRDSVTHTLTSISQAQPRYLEPLVVGRWFTDAYFKHVFELSDVKEGGGQPFIEVLLDAVGDPNGATSTKTGTRLEAAAGLALSITPGFEVDSARKTTDEQIDLVVRYTPDRLSTLGLDPGFGLVECKSSKDPVSVSELRDFGAKCLFHRVHFGILVARAGTTGSESLFKEPQNAELVRRRFQTDGLTILVLNERQLRGKARELRGLQDELNSDHRLLVFGPVP